MPGPLGTWHRLSSVEHGTRRDLVRYILHIYSLKMLNYIVIFSKPFIFVERNHRMMNSRKKINSYPELPISY